jgi:hypothetical protein
MILTIQPPSNFSINTFSFSFNESRKSIRSKGMVIEKVDDQVIVLDKNDPSKTIYQRRDIYKNINMSTNFFFFGYDKEDLLQELEIHLFDQIKIFDIVFSFDTSIDFIAKKLERYSSDIVEKSGEYLFKDIKLLIQNKNAMGGEGNTLGYLYWSSDISHLDNLYKY